MATVETATARIAYDVSGKGEHGSVVLAHAITCNRSRWGAIAADLVDSGYRVVTFDHRGVGETRVARDSDWSIATFRDDLLAVADAAGLERFHIGGISLGGVTALATAMSAPQRVISVTAASIGMPHSSGRLSESGVSRLATVPLRPDDPVTEFADRLATITGPGRRRGDAALLEDAARALASPLPLWGTIGGFRAMLNWSGWRHLGTISTPVTILHGQSDPLVSQKEAADLVDAIPSAALVSIRGIGHVTHVEAPREFVTAVAQSLPAA